MASDAKKNYIVLITDRFDKLFVYGPFGSYNESINFVDNNLPADLYRSRIRFDVQELLIPENAHGDFKNRGWL